MKSFFAALVVTGALFALSGDAFALPPDLNPPPAAFGDAERDGTLLVTDDLRDADFGGGLRLPVRWVYRSSNQATNPYGWDGFSLTMLEAKAVKKTVVLYEITLLCGKVIYFNKGSGEQNESWKSNDTQWSGVEEDDGAKFTITSWDGWKIEFAGGRIRKFVTDDNRTILWSYDSTDARLVTSVKESGHDPIVEIEISADPLKMAGSSAVRGAHKITVNGDVYTLYYAGGTLREIAFPDGRKTQWRFENNGINTAEKRLTLTQESGWWRSWVFIDESRLLKSDDVWSYGIVLPEKGDDGVVYNRPSMERTRIATGEKQTISYEAANSIQISTDVLGNVTKTYLYKTSGKLYDKAYKVERKRAGESTFATIWRGTFDASTGDLIRSYDASDNETEFSYERFSGANEFQPPKKITTTDPLGRFSTVERDIAGNVIEVVNAAGVKRKMEWDARRRLTRIKNAANDVLMRLVYGDKDEILERYDALANKTELDYTIHLGSPLLVKVTSPLGLVAEWTRDTMGRVTKMEGPSGAEWNYAYVNDWSVVEKITDPLANETDYEYDARLNESKVTDALSHETETDYDDLDLPEEVTDALAQVTKLEWNANGSLKKLTDSRNKDYTMAWESGSQRKELKWPDNGKQSAVFDVAGNVSSFHPRGTDATINYTRNAAQELTGQGWVNGSTSGTASLTRNSVGQLTGAETTAMTLTVSGSYGYNAEGQMSSASQNVGGVTRSASLTYDLDGTIKTITYPAGFVVQYDRNADGQVTAIKKDGTALATYAYDAAGRLSTRTLSSGVVTTYGYDGMDRINQIAVTGDGSMLWAERYGYNAVGQRVVTLKGASGTVGDAYSLNATSQLVGVKYGATGADDGYSAATSPASAATWTYDAAGNRQTQIAGTGTTSYTVNTINQYTEVEGSAPSEPTYTTRGDLATQGDWQYTYDAFGNLIQAHNAASNLLAKYWRDAFGHRAVKDVDGSKTVFFNLGTAQLEAYGVTVAMATSTIYEPGIDRPLAEVGPDGTVKFYHQDWLGNVVMLTNTSGVKVQSYTYDAWGKPIGFDAADGAISETAILSKFLYTAREFDRETGLYHYRARAYSSELGRFVQNDPIDFAGRDGNLVRYVANNPINFVDPDGLSLRDVQRIVDTARRETGNMTKERQRTDPGWLNNLSIWPQLLLDQPSFLGCGEQADKLKDSLDKMDGLDDNWKFSPANDFPLPHQYLIGTSDNPFDPPIIIDPWRNSFTPLWGPRVP